VHKQVATRCLRSLGAPYFSVNASMTRAISGAPG
jgi:hypothetical protein